MLMKYEDMLVATTDLFGLKFNKKIDKEKGSSSNKGLVSLGKSYDQEKKRPFTGGQSFRGKGKSRGHGARGWRTATAMDEDVGLAEARSQLLCLYHAVFLTIQRSIPWSENVRISCVYPEGCNHIKN